jgi:drug/metabolite transporter (DMT)-like permease
MIDSMPNRQPFLPPILVLVFGILAVSTASIFIRKAQLEAPSLVIAAYRMTVATLVIAPYALLRKRGELSTLSRREFLLALLSGIFLAIHFAAWISSLEYTTVASSVVFVSTVPLWVALLAPITIKESVYKLTLVGLGLALIGGTIVGLSDTCIVNPSGIDCPTFQDLLRGQAFLGDILALIGAFAAAGYLIIGRNLRVKVSLTSYVFIVYGIAGVILIGFMLAAGQSPFGYSPITYLWFILLGLIPQLIGHSSYNWALAFLSAAYVSIALLGEPIGSSILAFVFLQEVPSSLKILGAVFILFGIFLASRSEKAGNERVANERREEERNAEI